MSGADTRNSLPDRGRPPAADSAQPHIRKLLGSQPDSVQSFWGGNPRNRSYWFNYVWLIYSAFFVIVPFQENTARGWIFFAAAYFCFLAIYFGIHNLPSAKHQLMLLGALFLLGCGYLPLNPGACGIFIYVTAFLPFVLESSPVVVTLSVACAGSVALEGWLLHQSPWGWVICAVFSLAVGVANLGLAQKMRAGWRLGLAQEEIAHLAKVAERERIARDLHDVLGHTLSVVVLKSELAGKLMERDPERAKREIGEVETIARKALTEVREAIRGYRAEGLEAELARARSTLDAAGVALECGGKPPALAPAEETVLSLIVREAVTNIVRHAQASRCRMVLEANGAGTALVVEDDGQGGIREEGNGLRGMRERVESLGGKLSIDSGHGTRLEIQLPAQGTAKA